jgi:hypothetical protein
MNKRKWYNYVFETQDDSYKQKLYKIPIRFKVRKLRGGNKSETEDDFRAVDTVTALSLPRDRKSDAENWYMTYDVKFELPHDKPDVARYARLSLVPELGAVLGVEILSFGEAFQVYDAQNSMVGDPEKDRSKVFGGDKRKLTKKDDNIQGEG